MNMVGKIIGIIFSAIVGRLLEWFKTNELEQQAALAQELKQHAESVIAAQAAQDQIAAAVQAHQEAASQVTDLQAQLDALKKWNERSRGLRVRAKELKVKVKELKKGVNYAREF